MLTGFVCYIERTPGGNGLRRLRLVGPELDQSWVAPATPGDPSRPLGPGEQLAHIRSAAAWLAEEIAPVRELAAICLDPEGGVCSWVSAPSADPRVVLASIRQVGVGATGVPMETAPPPSGFGLLPDDSLGAGGGRSIQALAEDEAKPRTSILAGGRGGAGGRSREPVVGPRKRLGVISVADAPVRVLLDELDRLKIGVGAVLSLWHAAALAWDPSVASQPAPSRREPKQNGTTESFEPIVVEADAPVTAAVIVDPAGRLIWAWSKGGDLLAAGTMRLRTHSYSRTLPQAPGASEGHVAPDSAIIDLGSGVHRVPEEPADAISAAECSSGDVGRLIMDWLAWSVQVGHTPDRVACIGPATIPQRPAPNEPPPTPESLARSLAGAWPGATVDAAIHDDPIGATLNRLRALPMFAPARSPSADSGLVEDPRRNLVTLTTRPGRFDRTMHYWAAVAVIGAAVAIYLYTRRLGAGIEALRESRDAVQAQRIGLLEGVENLVPAVSKTADPIGLLGIKINEINEQITRVAASKPVLLNLLPAMEIFKDEEFASVQISSINASDVDIRFEYTVPGEEELLLPKIHDKFNARFGPNVWQGNRGSPRNGRIPYSLSWHLPGARN